MGFLCSLYNNSIRLLFSAFVIYLGLKGLSEVNVTSKYAEQAINLLGEKSGQDLEAAKKFTTEILFFQNFCLIFGGFLCVFGFRLRKFFIGLGLVLYMLLVQNAYFFENTRCNFLKVLSIFGGAMLA